MAAEVGESEIKTFLLNSRGLGDMLLFPELPFSTGPTNCDSSEEIILGLAWALSGGGPRIWASWVFGATGASCLVYASRLGSKVGVGGSPPCCVGLGRDRPLEHLLSITPLPET